MKTYPIIVLLCFISASLVKGSGNGDESNGQLRAAAGDLELREPDGGARSMNACFDLTKKQREKLAARAIKRDGKAARRLSDYYGFIANDRMESLYWTRMAAGFHDPSAEYNFGYTLLNLGSFGLSPSLKDRDVPRAKYWLTRAKDDGEREAEKRLKEIDEIEQLASRNKNQPETSYERWIAAMPKSIYPLWATEARARVDTPLDMIPLRAAIAKEFPDVRQRALVLFSWFGSGEGPWSGFPVYETAAEELLLDISTPDLIAAAESENLSQAQVDGAARLFGGWTFSHRRPGDSQTLPSPLKKKLLDHVLNETTDDNLTRAMNAFGHP